MAPNQRLMTFSIIVSLCGLACGADWPQFRGPNADGFSLETNINKDWNAAPPKELWRVPLSDKGYAGPSVADGKVFIVDHQDKQDVVRAIDLQNGKDIWTFAYPDCETPVHGFTKTTPTFEAGRLYVQSRLGLLHCLDASSGKSLWSKNLLVEFKTARPAWDYSSSPVIDGSNLIVCPGGSNALVVALDKLTGRTLWQGGGDDRVAYATPVVATLNSVKQYLIFSFSGLQSVSPEGGRRLWFFPWRSSGNVNAANPLVHDSKVFISSGYGEGGTLLDCSGPEPKALWKNKVIQAHFSSPIFFGGCIYGTTDPGDLVCMDFCSGQQKWRHPGFEKGGIISVDNTIIALDGKHGFVVMVALDPTAYKELGRIQPLGGRSWTAPVFANHKLLIRNATSLVCLDLNPASLLDKPKVGRLPAIPNTIH